MSRSFVGAGLPGILIYGTGWLICFFWVAIQLHAFQWLDLKIITTIKYHMKLSMTLSSGKKLVSVGGTCRTPGNAGSGLPGPPFLLTLHLPHIPKSRNSRCQVGWWSPLISNHLKLAGQQEGSLTCFPHSGQPSCSLHCGRQPCGHLAQRQAVWSYPNQLAAAMPESEGQGWATAEGN